VAGLVSGLLLVLAAAAGTADGRAGKPDLRVRSLSNPTAVVARGGPVRAALRVANVGTRTARRSTVRGFLSRDTRKSRSDVPLQPARSVPRLKPGRTTRRTLIARVPRATPTGRWFLIACADAARMVRETNERNNCRTSARRTVVTSGVRYVVPADGATVSGVTVVRVRAPAGTDWIGVYVCGGASAGEDLVSDGNNEWSIQWDTAMVGCTNGPQNVDTWAFREDGSNLGHAEIEVNVQNSAPPPPPPPPPSSGCEGLPKPGPAAAMSLSFSDCFDILNRGVWANRQWYEPAPPLDAQYVEGGVLHVVSRRSQGYQNTSVSTEPLRQANPKSFKQGYFEARMRWTAGNGSSPAFWLFSTRHATNPNWPNVNSFCSNNGLPVAECYSGEIDVFEGQGHEPSTFIGTIHRNSCNCYGVENQFRQGVPSQNVGVNMTTGFHIYAVRWTPTQITWYLDGVQIGTTINTYDSLNQPMHLIFTQWPRSWTRDTDSSSPDVLHTEVDWVRVWQN
jgi:hypothetical protein